ncbi:MAG: NAD(P)-dependent oxidoreductase [Nibricoccus sp.]
MKNASSPTVLITGVAGYLGSVVAEHFLNAGHRVIGIDNLSFGSAPLNHLCSRPEFEFIREDARNEAAMAALVKKSDVIIPLAAVVGMPACLRDPWLAQSVNLEAIRMLNRVRSPNQLVIYPNTNSGYGIKSGSSFCTEETPLDPISLYGQTKCQAELELLNSANTITLRLATVFGMSPRMRLDLLVNHFVYTAITDGYLVIFEKDFKRNFVHVRDVADCMLHCVANSGKMVGKPYNVGLDSANLSKAELAMKVKEFVPNFYIHFSEVGTDPDKRNYIVSNQRLREAGFEAKRSLETGIPELIKGYRLIGRSPYKNV